MSRSIRATCVASRSSPPSAHSSNSPRPNPSMCRPSYRFRAANLADTRHIASASITETANAASALFEPGSGHAICGGFRLRM
ncbi:hypothetical protein RA307_18280 [Xanthobacteraceae bacterium Astr-EGSB]|uniref:hypothetical protein n=1 Tax=Astrobacterium formosum TaxID=3069710 RepID=UPI0027B3F937|nr:hypothetical protein [Xanthobacteraceae bacterium Astr-EGSB]